MDTPKKTSPLAIVSLVSGLLAWTFLPFIGAIAAVITGHLARGEIRRSDNQLEGDGMALAGLILGWISIILTIIAVALVVYFIGGLAYGGWTGWK